MKTLIVTVTLLSTLFLNSLKAQEVIKDTLFFKYDPKYILNFKEAPEVYYLQDSHNGSSGTFFFKEVKRISYIKNKIKCLKKFVRSSESYSKDNHLNDRETAFLFNNFIVFLVRKEDKKTEYIQVQGVFEIE